MSEATTSTPAKIIVKKPWYREYAEALFVAAILALIIRSFVVQAFKIPSGSMEDTLLIGDHLLVNKFIYGVQIPFFDGRYLTIRHPQRGDVIVFEFPEDEGKSYFQRRDFIKRVVGVPGDTIEVRNKQVFVNDELYQIPEALHKEPNLIAAGFGPRDFMAPVTVPPDSFFVMGDNRDRSYDSRFWGFVAEQKVKGLAFIKYWSWNSQGSWLKKIRWDRIGRPIN
jgi:signal peptidase I